MNPTNKQSEAINALCLSLLWPFVSYLGSFFETGESDLESTISESDSLGLMKEGIRIINDPIMLNESPIISNTVEGLFICVNNTLLSYESTDWYSVVREVRNYITKYLDLALSVL